MILLEVLSWEERARILTKVWIAGIALALFAVAWYIWLQYNRKKKLKRLHQRRGMKPKQKTEEAITYHFTLAAAASENLQKKLKIKQKEKTNTTSIAYTSKADYVLAGLSMEQESTKKVLVHRWYIHNPNDQRAMHWLLKRLLPDLKSQNFESMTYRVSEKDADDLLNMLEAYGFKRVALAKKERKKYKYALKLFI